MILTIPTDVICTNLGNEEGFRLIKETGFDGVDFSFYRKNEAEALGEDYMEHAEKFKALLKNYDLICNQAHAPFNFTYGHPMDCTDPMYQKMVRSMEVSAFLGIKQIVVHGFVVPEGVDRVQANLNFFKSLEPYCKKFGIKIAVENLRLSTKTLETHNHILESLNPEYFVGLVDVGHAILQGYTAQEYIAGILPGRLQGLHIHDNFGQKDDHLLPGLGVIEWDQVINALAERNYPGDFTLETNNFERIYGENFIKETLRFNYMVTRRLADQLDAALKER